MDTKTVNYQCPNCTGPLKYAGESGQLECEHCGTKLEVSVAEQLYADKEQAAASNGAEPDWDVTVAGTDWGEEESSHIRAYVCPSCAAEIICEETTAATSCPYCGNPTVVPGKFTGQLKPDYVIPFKLDRNSAVNALAKYYKGKKFLPKNFADANHIEEIRGVYVPFWLFDGESEADMRFSATKVSTRRSGGYEITDTDHYRVTREGGVRFEKVPVDGSSKMPDAHMDAIEPFDYGGLKPFSTAYLPGYLADRYDEDAETCGKRANRRIVESTERAFASTTKGYATLKREYYNINLTYGEVKYALMPVWMLATRWRNKNFLFAMNGQTGKLIGDLPVDRGKFWGWFAKIALPAAAVIAIALFLL